MILLRNRKYISLKTKLASALCQMVRDNGEGRFVPVIPYEEAKTMTEDAVIGKFNFDHGIFHAIDGSDEFWNLTPLPKDEHREKTAKVDIPAIAKTKRLASDTEEFRRKILAKEPGQPRERSKWPKGKWGKR